MTQPPMRTTDFNKLVWYNEIESISLALQHDIRFLNHQDIYGNTPSHYATLHHHINCLHLFTSLGANLNLKNNKGQTCMDVHNQGQLELIEDDFWVPMNEWCAFLLDTRAAKGAIEPWHAEAGGVSTAQATRSAHARTSAKGS